MISLSTHKPLVADLTYKREHMQCIMTMTGHDKKERERDQFTRRELSTLQTQFSWGLIQ